ncbi:phosphate/phosphite/phosphonate ABC transporter substrate-binding protein [Companilactobacillus mishanensis]|nr:phosphate/phosphite/phosphonate ABC transporter substrate-binding protein [Companilactobacillus mishanensis]
MKKGRFLTVCLGVMLMALLGGTLAGCSSKNSSADGGDSKKLSIVFYPNESAKDYLTSRNELKAKLEKATGKKVEIKTTTDYNVAIEAISSGKAQLAFMGADGYIKARNLNKAVEPILTESGPDGTFKGASYRSYLMVPEKEADNYKTNGKYSLDKVKGKKISFVSASSTSGYAVPTYEIQKHFKLKNKDSFAESGKFFSKVLYGNSHPGSAVNLLKGDVDIAAFDDIDLTPFLKVTSGNYSDAGSVFTVKDDATAPFVDYRGQKVVNISTLPVQNGPVVANTKALSDKDKKAIQKLFTSKEVSDDPKLFAKDDAKVPALWHKKGDKSQLLKVDDNWYKPTHELIGK